MKLRHFLAIGFLMEMAYFSFYWIDPSANRVLLFIAVHVLAYALLALLIWRVGVLHASADSGALPSAPSTRTWVLGFAILFRLTLIFHPPVGSDDIYRYVWDGKVAAHGINPYRYAPSDSALTSLHSEHLPSRVNHPTMHTIYPPLAQGFFLVSYKIFGESLTGMKFLLVLADIVSILLLMRIAMFLTTQQSHRPGHELIAILYAWSPLPILYFGLDGHIDALGIPFFLLAIYFVLRSRRLASAVTLGISALTKVYPLIVAPFFFNFRKNWKTIFLVLVAPAILLLGYVPFWDSGREAFTSFRVFSSEFAFNGSLFKLFYLLTGSNAQAHLISSIAFCCWLGVVFSLDRPFIERCFLAFVGFFVVSPLVHPWYLTWLAVLLPLRWSTSVFVFLGLSVLSNVTVYQYRLGGIWQDNIWVLKLEYIPFYLLLVREAFFHRHKL
ncbi:MAG: DUF2029 domain-containing protein [Ignavibacteriae bacterium]|nr:DUF2029 domain-containing protein [Ignavibacteriota bacterium]